MADLNKAVTAGQWEYHFVEGQVFITGGVEHDVQIALNAVLCHALRLSGHLSEALKMNIEATDRAHETFVRLAPKHILGPVD